MKSFLLKLHWLSLDVAIGAVCSGLFFNNTASTLLPLGVSTWIIYLSDRLLDVYKNPDIKTERHVFHLKNKKKVLLLTSVLCLVNFITLFFVHSEVIYLGLMLGSVTLIYAAAVFKTSLNTAYFKELSVAVIYTAGVAGLGAKNYLLLFAFFMVIFQSLLIFSRFEIAENPTAKNFVGLIGFKAYGFMICCIFILVFSLFWQHQTVHFLILCSMSAIQVMMEGFRRKLTHNNIYRIMGELVFWLPALSIFK